MRGEKEIKSELCSYAVKMCLFEMYVACVSQEAGRWKSPAHRLLSRAKAAPWASAVSHDVHRWEGASFSQPSVGHCPVEHLQPSALSTTVCYWVPFLPGTIRQYVHPQP